MTESPLLESASSQDWVVEKAPSGFTPIKIYVGEDPNQMALEVAIVKTGNSSVSRDALAKLHKSRLGNKAYPLVVVALSDSNAWLFGPSPTAAIIGPLERGQTLRLLQSALAEPNSIAATQRLAQIQVHVGTSSKLGITNSGLFASHHLNNNVPKQANWNEACQKAKSNLNKSGIDLINGLGFTAKRAAADAVILTGGSPNPRAVAVLLDEAEHFDASSPKYQLSPVAYGLKVANEQDVPWLILLRGGQIRLYPAKDGVGVGQRGQADTFFELDLGLLADEDAGLLHLVFSSSALSPNGTTEQILKDSAKYATELGSRLKTRIYENVIPELAKAVASQLPSIEIKVDTEGLQLAYKLTLRILFRLLFQAYAEDRGLLPFDRNERYTNNALKTIVIRDLIPNIENNFDPESQTLWDDLTQVWHAIDSGAKSWNVPAYNGGLFGEEEDLHYEGFLIKQMSLRDDVIGPALKHMFVDVSEDGIEGPVDFRSLSVREFGTIYEGLLESSLSRADQDLTVDSKGAWVPAKDGDPVIAANGDVYFHSSSGERKATGSYFTPSIIVDHLLDRSLEPALEQHFVRVKTELDAGNETQAHEIFFDFRVADLAMGSGHFLVSAVDRIESAMRNFLVENHVPGVSRELQRLEAAAKEALGDDYQFAGDIDKAGLLRRQIARRCIYGLDINPLAVELSRLALWIHTFVPGLPMSSLDHGLVCANSLTGIGTINEAIEALEPNAINGQISIFEGTISDALDKAKNLLIDAANADEANKQEVKDAANIAKKARKAAEATRYLFDAAVAARIGTINSGNFLDPQAVRTIGESSEVQETIGQLNPAHMPYIFPEVFLRDNPGFDVLVGNPPWEELMVEEPKFWLRISPGLLGLSASAMKERIHSLREARPDLVIELEQLTKQVSSARKVLLSGPYPGIGTGDVDLYQAFAWRNFQLIRNGGFNGIVYPRSLLNSAGAEIWRKNVLAYSSTEVTTLVNSSGWAFPGVHNQYIVALVAIQKSGENLGIIKISGPFNSINSFLDGVSSPGVTSFEVLSRASSLAALPQLPDARSVNVFNKLLKHPRLDEKRETWDVSPVSELHATNERAIFDSSNSDLGIPVLGGISLELWGFNSQEVYAYADPETVKSYLQQKRANQGRTKSSVFYQLNEKDLSDCSTLPFMYPRIAFRDVTNSLDTRTLIITVVPKERLLTNTAPYLYFKDQEKRNEPYLLGVLSSFTVDWFVRKYVGLHVNFHIFNSIPVPKPNFEDELTSKLIELTCKLQASNEHNVEWSKQFFPTVVGLAEKDLISAKAELEALVAILFGLDFEDIQTIFDTFHKTTDYSDFTKIVIEKFQEWTNK